MKFFELFVQRPVATALLFAGIILAGIAAYFRLPLASMPPFGTPYIVVRASLPGASPETMATSVATPLERRLGAIADVDYIYSRSRVGNTNVSLRFNLGRDIDGAARDVQAAISAAHAELPAALQGSPTYRKIDPSTYPILFLTLTSDTMNRAQIYDAASTILAQSISQVPGVGLVGVDGGSLPAVRVELNPSALFKYGIGLENVRAALSAANANSPKGAIEDARFHWQIYANDQADSAAQYRDLIVAYRNGAPIRLSNVANVMDSVESISSFASSNGKEAVIVWISPQPRANIIDTVRQVRALLPQLQASIPGGIHIAVTQDTSIMIRASLRDAEYSFAIAVFLVVLVVLAFLGDGRATLIPGVALPVSIFGTLGAMYLLGYSLDNFSLIALTIATGFVVDDTIVVMENTVRHLEMGVPRLQAALLGVREVGFTVLAMTLSLVAVFSPVLLMGGIEGILFHEFAGTLAVAILFSLVVSLTLTPVMCSRVLRRQGRTARGRFRRGSEKAFQGLLGGYERSLDWALRHGRLIALILLGTIGLNVWLFTALPKGFFPQEDTGSLGGSVRADQSASFQHLVPKLKQAAAIVQADPAIATVVSSTGGEGPNLGRLFIQLKPLSIRKSSAAEVIARIRPRLAHITGANIYLYAIQNINSPSDVSGDSVYEYVLRADNLSDARDWIAQLVAALKTEPVLRDVKSEEDEGALEAHLTIDRDNASRLGLSTSQIDDTLFDAFGERQVSTIYKPMNQYHVVMVVQPQHRQGSEDFSEIYVSASGGAISGTQSSNSPAGTFLASGTGAAKASLVAADTARNAALNAIATTGRSAASTGQAVSTMEAGMIPLRAFSRHQLDATRGTVYHEGPFVSSYIQFNLAPGASLSDALTAIKRQSNQIHIPNRIQGSMAGYALSFQQIVGNEPLLILAAIVAIYIVLGVLYESYAHPLTILSTLPSAGVGAFLALILFQVELSLIAVMGLFLLIGIVMKNAIMMIDLAIQLERSESLDPREAIFQASLLRFRPIIMTTMAALLGALPLAIGFGSGAEFRRPLGIAIVGGLIVSQVLTLYTTPVVYLYVDRARLWCKRLAAKPGFISSDGISSAQV